MLSVVDVAIIAVISVMACVLIIAASSRRRRGEPSPRPRRDTASERSRRPAAATARRRIWGPPRIARRKLFAGVAGVAVLLTGQAATGSPAAGGHRAPASGLAWRSCGEPAYPALECAALKVPVDYARPDGRTISIALSRSRARRGSGADVLVVNPGGPGASGLTMAEDIAMRLPKNNSRDVVGFDPRGVGRSTPALSCDGHYFDPVRPDYVASGSRQEKRWLGRVRGYAAACRQKFGWLLPHMTTANAARDLDRIRAALGVSKISFLGYSYGTYLGAMFGHLFPRRIDRMVLDSIVAPNRVWYPANLGQNQAFEARLDEFFGWIARHRSTYRLGGTGGAVEERWYDIRALLRAHPAGGRVGASEFDDTFMAAGYDSQTWPVLAAAFAARAHGGAGKELVSAFDTLGRVGMEGENGYAVYTAVGCRDAPWPRSWRRWRSDALRVHRKAPFLTWNNVWYNAPCAFWSVPGERPVRIDGGRFPPTLLVQAERDAATPRLGAYEMRRTVPAARLVLERDSGDHGVSLAGNACVDRYVLRYLEDGALPGPARGAAGASGADGRKAGASRDVADATCAASPGPRPAQRGHKLTRTVSRCPGRLPYAGVVPHGRCR